MNFPSKHTRKLHPIHTKQIAFIYLYMFVNHSCICSSFFINFTHISFQKLFMLMQKIYLWVADIT